MKTTIDHLLIGTIKPYGPDGKTSAYIKSLVKGNLKIGLLGLEGDEQADLKNHGGKNKALLHYAFDHYQSWLNEQPHLAEHLTECGAFGENISTLGLAEDEVCIGDQYRLGTAIVEVSQGRQPCWKLGHRFNYAKMVKEVIQTGRSGWYYRVIEAGQAAAGDSVELLDKPHPEWSVLEVSQQLNNKKPNIEKLHRLTELEVLASEWKVRAIKLLDKTKKN